VRDRRFIIEFALIVIAMTVLGAVFRDLFPDVHQLVRFVMVLGVTIVLWLAVRAVVARFDGAGS
jgi:hypothetical protein